MFQKHKGEVGVNKTLIVLCPSRMVAIQSQYSLDKYITGDKTWAIQVKLGSQPRILLSFPLAGIALSITLSKCSLDDIPRPHLKFPSKLLSWDNKFWRQDLRLKTICKSDRTDCCPGTTTSAEKILIHSFLVKISSEISIKFTNQ
jgi:hypothetical protein